MMDFFKTRKLRRARKLGGEDDDPDAKNPHMSSGTSKDEILETGTKASEEKEQEEEEEDDDDDFITNEVKRRLKELRKNSFMVLIPEEGYPEEEDDEEEEREESSSSEWRDSEVVNGHQWCGFDSLYVKYCERMLFFDKVIAQLLKEGSLNISRRSPRSSSNKLASTLRSLSFKRRDELLEEREHLHLQQQQEDDHYQTLETAYVAQVSLSWEVLHCQYMLLSHKILSQPENYTSYCHAAQAFQQFQVLLQRFVENEPFEQGSRLETYAHARSSLSKLLQVPSFEGSHQEEHVEDDLEPAVLASNLIKVMEESILTFRLFLKMDKRKSSTLFRSHSHAGSSLQQVQASLDKKEMKVKELSKKKGWKKKTWPKTLEEVELLFSLIDIRVVSRVLRMARLSKEQLLWCEEKMSKLDLSDTKLHRDSSPILFPC
ncbi:uncharacterized protein [Typha angustifolia]|uniref:uncharacterized protein n=1 Tax=Typha angustifolia TaxID=59011 RepID=UPI003C2DFEFF